MTDVLQDEPLAFTPDSAGGTRRFFHMRDVEWRDSGSGESEYTFTGYPVVFNSWSELLWTPRGTFRERFMSECFKDVLATNPDVRLLKNHNKDLVLARTKSGTLEITEEEEAIRNWARIAKTSYATDLKLSMDRGDVDQMSVAFELDYDMGAEDRWYEDKKTGEVCHDIIRVSDVFDQSIVTFPAYAETSAVMRDMKRAQEHGTFEDYTINTIAPRHKQPVQKRGVVATGTTAEFKPRAYERCRQAMAEQVWAMHPSYIELFFSILDERAAGYKPSPEEIKERIGVKRDNEVTSSPGGIAVIPLAGPIFPRAGAMEELSGARSLTEFRNDFRQALNDPEVASIVLDIDSPGGVSDGIQEMADEIRAARGVKPIVAVSNYMAASAAYWIATAADELVVSPSADVGSVGVYAAHQDRSAQLEMEGIKTTFISAGEHKVELNPTQPLSEEARAYVQQQVDLTYEAFVGAVAKGRGTTKKDVLENFGQGRMKNAVQAVESGMADRVATIDDVLAELAGNKKKKYRSREVNGDIDENGDAQTTVTPDSDYYAEHFTPTILEGSTEAIPPHNTTVTNEDWDPEPNVHNAKTSKALRGLHAWVDGAAAPGVHSSYRFPHHEVDQDGNVGPANINAVYICLEVLDQSKIPEADKESVERHLQRHVEAWESSFDGRLDKALEEAGVGKEERSVFSGTVSVEGSVLVSDEQHVWSASEAQEFADYVINREFGGSPNSFFGFNQPNGLVAQTGTDSAGHGADVAPAETDPVGGAEGSDVASAETDPADDAVSVPVWKQQIKQRMQHAREERIRLTKEMLQ